MVAASSWPTQRTGRAATFSNRFIHAIRSPRPASATLHPIAGALLPWRAFQLSGSIGPLEAGPRVVVRVEGLLRRSVGFGDVDQVDPHPVPERGAAAHPV